MTVLVALKADYPYEEIYLGGDGLTTIGGMRVRQKSTPKVFKRGPYVIGAAGSPRLGQIIMLEMQLPEEDELNPYYHMVTRFIPELKKVFKYAGVLKNDQGEDFFTGTILVCYGGEIFEIDSYFSVSQYEDDYLAIGSGANYALGSLHSTSQMDIHPKGRVQLALEAAAEFDPNAGAPFEILCQRFPSFH